MEQLLGTSLPVFIGVTCILAGTAAWLTGQAVAATWRPARQAIGYAFLLGLADRFIVYALFDGELLSLPGYLVDSLVLVAIAFAAYRATLAAGMVRQYPWLYERAGTFGWRRRRSAEEGVDPS